MEDKVDYALVVSYQGKEKMIFVPFKRIIIVTPLSPTKVVECLRPRVTAKHSWWPSLLVGKFDFVGQVSETKINLLPVIGWNDPYLPQFKGRILASDSGSRLKITLMPAIWNIIIMLLALTVPMLQLRGARIFWAFSWLFVHIVTYLIGFAPLAERFELKLRELLNGESSNETKGSDLENGKIE